MINNVVLVGRLTRDRVEFLQGITKEKTERQYILQKLLQTKLTS